VRQRHGLPAGDFDRVKRQQNMIRAVMSKISKVDPTANPVQAYQLLDAMTKAITVDDSLTESAMRSLAFGMRGVGAGGGVSFLTAPVTGTGTEGDQSVVYLDQPKTAELWNGMNNDTMAAYLTGHQNDLLPAVPR
jgi:anionic cell wall polymer biosynthesis LytR-Cps2A-Psr (LCP) family protein